VSDSSRDIAALKKYTREAHETIQDLKSVVREARQVVIEIQKAAAVSVDERLQPILIAQINAIQEATLVAIAESEGRIEGRFDQMAAVMLGEDRKSVREGRLSLPQMAENIGALRRGEELPHDIDAT